EAGTHDAAVAAAEVLSAEVVPKLMAEQADAADQTDAGHLVDAVARAGAAHAAEPRDADGAALQVLACEQVGDVAPLAAERPLPLPAERLQQRLGMRGAVRRDEAV